MYTPPPPILNRDLEHTNDGDVNPEVKGLEHTNDGDVNPEVNGLEHTK